MYKNGDPKKKAAKPDATRVNITRLDIPLPSDADGLFKFKDGGVVQGAKLGLKRGKAITKK